MRNHTLSVVPLGNLPGAAAVTMREFGSAHTRSSRTSRRFYILAMKIGAVCAARKRLPRTNLAIDRQLAQSPNYRGFQTEISHELYL